MSKTREPRLPKELKESIDLMCEHEAPVVDYGIFVNKESRTAEDDHIAEIATFIAQVVIDREYTGDSLERVGNSIATLSKMISQQFNIIRVLNWEIEQRRRQMLNLERRLHDLEKKPTKATRYAYE